MKVEDKTKEQLIRNMAELQQRMVDLEPALIEREFNQEDPEPPLPCKWFKTGSPELYVDYEDQVNKGAKYRFSDLVDLRILRSLLNSFYKATYIPHSIIDVDNNILGGIGWQDICTRFHRVCPQTKYRCQQSDKYINDHLHETPYIGYKCLNGLIDYATPIVIEGEHLATIFMGQLLHEPPDEEFFLRQAKECGFDEAAYIEALKRVPIIPKEYIESFMEYFSHMGQVLASMGLEKLRRIEAEENKFLKALHCYPDPITITSSPDFRFIEVNDAWLKTTGFERNEAIDHDYIELGIGVFPPKEDLLLKLLQENESVHNIETKFRMKSGEIRSFLVSTEKIEMDDKPYWFSVHKDITERKQADMTLRLSEERFIKAFQCNADPMSITTLIEGRFVEVNDAFLEATGYEKNEVIGYTVGELHIWVITEERDLIIKQILEHGRIRNAEMNFRNKAGEIKTILVSGEIIDTNGKAHLLFSAKDITERKRMEEQLLLSEEILSKAFSNSPIIMGITTLEEERFIKVNHALCFNTDYSCEEVLGKSTLELGFWSDPTTSHVIKQRLMVNQPIHDMEVCYCTKTGEQRLGLFSAERLDVNGEPCILEILTDITEQRKIEDEINRLDRLNLVGEMAASIGHEIRNPMTAIRGFLQMMSGKEKYEEDQRYFDLMIEELDRANHIISEFLDMSKDKRVELKHQDFDEVVKSLYPMIQAAANYNEMDIQLDLNNPPMPLIDAKEIRQLIMNMARNGLEAMSSGGILTIGTTIDNNKIILFIKDQGHGMDPQVIDKLGTPFLTTKDKGTGLGLAICYSIAARHKARIVCETGPYGTTFKVYFPITTEQTH